LQIGAADARQKAESAARAAAIASLPASFGSSRRQPKSHLVDDEEEEDADASGSGTGKEAEIVVLSALDERGRLRQMPKSHVEPPQVCQWHNSFSLVTYKACFECNLCSVK
jgi:hypothetical protein